MKAIMIVDIPDDYEEYGNGYWYVVGDDLRIVYDDYGSVRHYKYIEDDIAELKPMPQRINPLKVDINNLLDLGYMHGRNDLINQMESDENE